LLLVLRDIGWEGCDVSQSVRREFYLQTYSYESQVGLACAVYLLTDRVVMLRNPCYQLHSQNSSET
jgi:hypothetical protein